MKLLAFFFAACGILAVASAADPAWSDLRGTFLILKDKAFAKFPRTIREDLFTSEEWTRTSSQENDCTNNGLFNGIQYVAKDDYSVGLLYDVQGVIAGIQMMVPHNTVLSENNTLRYGDIPMYVNATYNGEEYFVMTAYFVDPATICDGGRSDSTLASEGTGTGLWIQTGSPDSVLEVPMTRPNGEEADSSGWNTNNCFPAMGYHNFYRFKNYEPTNCEELDPVFGLYNRNDQLHGFGFITPGTVTNPRFEQPPDAAIKMILGDAPQCILDIRQKIGVTSIHVYFVPRPQMISCSIFRAIGSYARSATEWLSSFTD